MKRFALAVGIFFVIAQFFTFPVAAQIKDRGLLVTPPRQYLEVEPGKTVKSSLTVANITENPIDVALDVEQFSVADYTYEYHFDMPKEEWVKLEQTSLTLKKTESRTVSYVITAPADARPGGHYFTVFASATLAEGRKVRTATVLYVTVGGAVTKSSTIVADSVPSVSFGGAIPFSFDVRNTGNTHFIVYVQGRIQGLLPFANQSEGEVAHVLLPGKIRTISGEMSPPLLPGIYKAEYGYRDENGNKTERSRPMLYMPPWSIALVVGLVWLGILIVKRRKKGSTDSSQQ